MVFCCCSSEKSAVALKKQAVQPSGQNSGTENQKAAAKSQRLKSIRDYFRRLYHQLDRSTQRKSKWYDEDADQMAEHGYRCKQITGVGTFGIVYKACLKQKPDEIVAVKRIEVDNETDTREMETHRLAKHQNVIALKEYWCRSTQKGLVKKALVYMVMEYVPRSLEDLIQNKWRVHSTIPLVMIKIFSFQLFKGLNYLHQIRVLHRDIKPCNLLVDTKLGVLKICDFGCAKEWKRSDSLNRTYICSRYYRAPELVLKNVHNDESIDVWAASCVLAECFRGWPLFPGKSTLHQFGAIADVLGNPKPTEVRCLNPSISRMNLKSRDATGTFEQHFPVGTPSLALELMSKIFIYKPKERPTALAVCADPYYDQLRRQWKTFKLPSGCHLPPLFEFTELELKSATPDLVKRLLPKDSDRPRSRQPSRGSQKTTVEDSTISAETEALDENSTEVFSELNSSDVEERDSWDCRRIRIIDDECASSSSE